MLPSFYIRNESSMEKMKYNEEAILDICAVILLTLYDSCLM